MPEIANPNGAFGYTDLQTKLPFQSGEYKTTAAVTAKRLVSINTSGSVATTATDGTPSLVVGAALRSIASGGTGVIITQGICEDMAADGAITAGALLKRSVNTAGYVAATATPVAGEAIGVAMNASASNTVDVLLFPSRVLS